MTTLGYGMGPSPHSFAFRDGHRPLGLRPIIMTAIYDEIEIEDFTYDPLLEIFQYPCPCGDKFAISLDDLRDGEDIAVCPSCSLMVRVIFEAEDLDELIS